jgi:hypothetical protein
MDFQFSPSASPPQLPMPLHTTTTPPPVSMPLPPEATYGSREELYSSIQAWAAQYKYAFCISRSTRVHRGSRTRILYSCDRYGPPPPADRPQVRKRNTTTRKTGCQFSIIALEHTATQWEVRHRPGEEYGIHNHPPSQAISSHPTHRKLTQDEINQARSLHNAGKLY